MRRDDSQIESAGQDSFLDVTTNIVGILIILVIVVAMRAQNPIVSQASIAADEDKLKELGHNAAQVEYDARRLGAQVEEVNREIDAKSEEREALATMIAAAEKAIGDRRAKFDSSDQEDFDIRRQLNEGRAEIDRDAREIESLKSQPRAVQEVRHYPTPISHTVLGHEVHFQLLGGRISYVPIDEFIDDVRADMRGGGTDLAHITDRVGVVGPRNGFEFRYTMDVVMQQGRGVVGVRAKEFQVVPVSIGGETIEQALGQRSDFRTAMALHSPRDTTVTLWTYPDSFETYRVLKEELHRLGYATAGRPLPKGVLIGGSDHGTKSSAQ